MTWQNTSSTPAWHLRHITSAQPEGATRASRSPEAAIGRDADHAYPRLSPESPARRPAPDGSIRFPPRHRNAAPPAGREAAGSRCRPWSWCRAWRSARPSWSQRQAAQLFTWHQLGPGSLQVRRSPECGLSATPSRMAGSWALWRNPPGSPTPCCLASTGLSPAAQSPSSYRSGTSAGRPDLARKPPATGTLLTICEVSRSEPSAGHVIMDGAPTHLD